jgi:hypothetical protein
MEDLLETVDPIEIADLHVHSKESAEVKDMAGGKTPEEILDDIAGPREFTRRTYQGREVRVKAIAFTEHDTIVEKNRMQEIILYGRERGILVIPAIELDCTHDYLDQIHINCLFFFDSLNRALQNERFAEILETTRTGRRKSCAHTIAELIRHDYISPDAQNVPVEDMPGLYKILSDPNLSSITPFFENIKSMKRWITAEGYYRERAKPKAEAVAKLAHEIGFIFSIEHSRKINDRRNTSTDGFITERDRIELIKQLAPRALQVYYPYYEDQEFCRAKGIDREVALLWEDSENQRLQNSSGELVVPIGGSDFHSVHGTRNSRKIGQSFTIMRDLALLIDMYTKLEII